ncbi:MAG: GAF domain-containing protein, partial [Deltaproteobacteria bacterium]|nr:GAF domain-containing protein [Deltaproteobacteria bacterium]
IPAPADFAPAPGHRNQRDLAAAYEQLRAAYEMMQAVASADDLAALAHAILERALVPLAADRGALLLLDGEGALAPLAIQERAGAAGLGDIALPAALVEQVTASRRGVVVEGALAEGAAALAGDGPRAAIVVPLAVGGEVLGILYFDARSPAAPFGERALDILATVARPAALAIANARLCEQVASEARARLALERFLSPTLVEQVQRRALALGERGQNVDATILFADIRGFTALAEPMAAERVVTMLNEYFECAVEVVFRHDGVLDKYIGDALMAVWGVPAPAPDHARRALRAAVELRAAVAELNRSRLARGEAPLPIGIGVASGPVVAGLVGAPRRLEFTAVGDAVNVASRLCALAAAGEILAAEGALRACGDPLPFAVERQGARRLKGRARPLQVASVSPLPGDP